MTGITEPGSSRQAEDVRRFSELLRAKTGIDLAGFECGVVEMRIQERVSSLGLDGADEYHERLQGARPHDPEIQTLVDSILVNETLFYRYPMQMEILEKEVFTRFIRERRESPIRVWCAGCSTGAEPFSVSMAFEEACRSMGIRNAPERLFVLATDISEKALEAAARAVYEFRPVAHAPAWIIERYFERVNEQFKVRDAIRGQVTFRAHNLHDELYPEGFDVILCRNVLIYVDAAARTGILRKLHRSLNRKGLLFVGHAESFLDRGDLFSAEFRRGTICYVKQDRRRSAQRRDMPTAVDVSPPRPERAASVERPVHAATATGAVNDSKIDVSVGDHEAVLCISGCVDTEKFPDLPDRIRAAISRVVDTHNARLRRIRIVLRNISFVSSDIPQILLRAASWLGDTGTPIVIEADEEPVRRFLSRHGLS